MYVQYSQEQFQANIGRKVRIFSLDRKNNIHTEKKPSACVINDATMAMITEKWFTCDP